MMVENPEKFKKLVEETLVRHVDAINLLSKRGMKFWDYGNSFLLEAGRAGADVMKKDETFKYPSYVQDIMYFHFLLNPQGRHFLFRIWSIQMGLYFRRC
jgi:urocanate hydratase